MKFSRDTIINELQYIENNFEFSPECSVELQMNLFSNGLVEDIDGSIFTTYEGDILLGKDVEELKDIYNTDNDGFFHEFHKGEIEDESF